jgi:PIN domain nuclease of toxin-antitoxin system
VTAAVTDTHALLWYWADDLRLSPSAARYFAEAEAGTTRILVPTIVLVEAIYLMEKRRLAEEILNEILTEVQQPNSAYQLAPLDLPVVLALRTIDRVAIPDLPDRVIAATALAHRVPLISRDGKIRVQGVETIW